MKKILFKSFVLIVFVMLILIGCEKKNSESNSNKTVEKVEYKKAIVVYFSRAGENYSVGVVDVGNTAIMAGYIKDYLGADSFEIIPKVPYPEKYDEAKEIANKELSANARPEIKNSIKNLNDYDTVFLGYPIWCSDMPMIIYTFIEKYNLSGKTVVPFNTHEGSGSAGTYAILKSKLKNSNVNENGLALTGKIARTDSGKKQTIEWLQSLGY